MSTQVLSVTLPAEIIYVTGTVNGTAYTWTLIEGAWTATVDRAADDTYAVALTAVNAAGTSSNFELTLYYGLLTLITDRTAEDVAGRFQKLGYDCPVSVKKSWSESDTPTAGQMETYRQNIATLRRQIAVMRSTEACTVFIGDNSASRSGHNAGK